MHVDGIIIIIFMFWSISYKINKWDQGFLWCSGDNFCDQK